MLSTTGELVALAAPPITSFRPQPMRADRQPLPRLAGPGDTPLAPMAIVDVTPLRCPIFVTPAKPVTPRDASSGLRPMEARWASGQTVMPYQANYRPMIRADHEARFPVSKTLELRRLIDSQPRPQRNPFLATDTRRNEVPSEYALARDAGIPMLSLDWSSADDGGSLADTVTTTEAVSFATVDPHTEFLIESERRAAYSGPLLRTRFQRTDRGSWIRTTGVPYNRRLRIERYAGDNVYVFDAQTFTRPHYVALERHYRAWLATWLRPGTTLQDDTFARMAPPMRAARVRGRRALSDAFDHDPYRFRFNDPEMEAPFEEIAIELDEDDVARCERRFGRAFDLLYAEEVQEYVDLKADALRARGETVPVLRHLRGHRSWAEASLARPHIGDYVASADDILS